VRSRAARMPVPTRRSRRVRRPGPTGARAAHRRARLPRWRAGPRGRRAGALGAHRPLRLGRRLPPRVVALRRARARGAPAVGGAAGAVDVRDARRGGRRPGDDASEPPHGRVTECRYRPFMTTALVTGGNTGLGAAFARRLAADGHDLVLVARDKERLEQTAAELRAAHGVQVETLPADLVVAGERAVVEERLATVDVLVNNAAVIVQELFDEAPVAALQEELDVNVTAVLRLTRAALPGMIARGRGTVINLSSFAGYLAPAGWSYAAGKAWVLGFTDTVAASLEGTGVRVIAVAPGAVKTGYHERAGLPTGGSARWLTPEAVVDRCFADLARGRALSVPGTPHRVVVGALELPRRTLRGLSRLARRNRERNV